MIHAALRRCVLISSVLVLVVALPPPLTAQSADDPWEGPYTWFSEQDKWEIEHAALIGKPGPHQGKVILVRDHIDRGLWLWDPAAPTTVEPYHLDNPVNNLACANHSFDGEGDLIWSGGDKNDKMNCSSPEPLWGHVLYPDEWFCEAQQDMLVPPNRSPNPPARFGYYYPRTVALHSGDVASFGGGSAPWNVGACGPAPPVEFANVWQWYNKAAGRWDGKFPGQANDEPFDGLPTSFTFSWYANLAQLSTGHLFLFSQTVGGFDSSQNRNWSCSAWLDVSTWPPLPGSPPQWTMQAYPGRLVDAQGNTVNLQFPTGVLLPYDVGFGTAIEDRAMVIGGYDWQPHTWSNPNVQPTIAERQALGLVWEILWPQAGGVWSIPAQYGALTHHRVYANAVITPDLKLIVLGGSRTNFFAGTDVAPDPVYEPEMLDLLNPAAGWQVLSAHTSPRLYHSVAVLLKDGRILHASGYKKTVPAGALEHTDAEIYSPPCIQQVQPRPTIVSGSTTIGYGTAIPALTVGLAGSATPNQDIDFATLIRCGSVTHHFDSDQRCIRLKVTPVAGSEDEITLAPLPSQAQGGHFLAPPGYYYLFVVTTPRGDPPVRVPSVARFVHIS